jgi:hypothetical protein
MKTKKQFSMTALALLAIIAIALTACDNNNGDEETHTHTWGAWKSNAARHWRECTAADGAKTAEGSHTGNPCTVCHYETPQVPDPTSAGGLTFVSASGTPATGGPFDVTVKSDDEYLTDEWTALVNSVKVELEATYSSSDTGGADRTDLRNVFGAAGATVVLKKDLTTNWEVKAGTTQGVLYIKTSAVSSITASSYMDAVRSMATNTSSTSVTKASPAKGGVFLANVPDTRISSINDKKTTLVIVC